MPAADEAGIAALKSQLALHIGPIGRRQRIGLDEYSVYSDARLLRATVEELARRAEKNGGQPPDVIGAMGPSGIPLAVSLVSRPGSKTVRWIYVTDAAVGAHARKDNPIKPPAFRGDPAFLTGKHVLLVDSVIKSGSTAFEAATKVKLCSPASVRVMAILDYDQSFGDRTYADDLKAKFGVAIESMFTFVPKGTQPSADWLVESPPPPR